MRSISLKTYFKLKGIFQLVLFKDGEKDAGLKDIEYVERVKAVILILIKYGNHQHFHLFKKIMKLQTYLTWMRVVWFF